MTVSALQHHVHDGEKWVRQFVHLHLMMTGVTLGAHIPSYSDSGFLEPEFVRLKRVVALYDSGAQMFELLPSKPEEPPDPSRWAGPSLAEVRGAQGPISKETAGETSNEPVKKSPK